MKLDLIPTFLPLSAGSIYSVYSLENTISKHKRDKGCAQLQELTVHLTTRADDSHATPESPKILNVSERSTDLLELVRLRAYYRIKPHAPPLV